jgi:hypothetical protein
MRKSAAAKLETQTVKSAMEAQRTQAIHRHKLQNVEKERDAHLNVRVQVEEELAKTQAELRRPGPAYGS